MRFHRSACGMQGLVCLLGLAACKRQPEAGRKAVRPATPVSTNQAAASAGAGPELSAVTLAPIGRDVSVACDTAAFLVRESLALTVRRQDGDFADSFQGTRRLGCRLTARGSFSKLSNRAGPIEILSQEFENRHWGHDLRYDADGPDGSDVGMRQREALCLVMGRWDGGDDSDTSSAARPPTPEEDRFDVIVECVHDVPSNADAGVPDSIWKTAASAGLDSLYAIAVRVRYPPYIDGDFDGDGLPDAAVLVEQRSTGKLGVAFVHYRVGRVFVVGAGNAIAGGGDDLWWIDEFDALRRGMSFDTVIRDRPTSPTTGDALWVARRDSISAFLIWNGRGYAWEAHAWRK
jgi:hypothetical protein